MFIEMHGTPLLGETVNCEHEGRNVEDSYVVSLWKDGVTVGHVPHIISCACRLFLRHGGAVQCTITDQRKYLDDLLKGGLKLTCTY